MYIYLMWKAQQIIIWDFQQSHFSTLFLAVFSFLTKDLTFLLNTWHESRRASMVWGKYQKMLCRLDAVEPHAMCTANAVPETSEDRPIIDVIEFNNRGTVLHASLRLYPSRWLLLPCPLRPHRLCERFGCRCHDVTHGDCSAVILLRFKWRASLQIDHQYQYGKGQSHTLLSAPKLWVLSTC